MTAANDLSVQMASTSTLILIPARMASSRLPGKPLADIAGLPMIVQVLRRAEEAKIGRAVVATDTDEIANAVKAHGGEAVMTRADHPSGSDRIFEALERLDPDGKVETVVNLQGDLPTIPPQQIFARCSTPLADPVVDIATLAAEIHVQEEDRNPNVVKVIGSQIAKRPFARALFHAGDRADRRRPALPSHRALCVSQAALASFVALPPSPLELRERLEQLRAIEAGMRIDVTIVDQVPRGVDTHARSRDGAADLEARSDATTKETHGKETTR